MSIATEELHPSRRHFSISRLQSAIFSTRHNLLPPLMTKPKHINPFLTPYYRK